MYTVATLPWEIHLTVGWLADIEMINVCADICNSTADASETCSLTEEPTAQSHLSVHFVRYFC